jgi:hypothetical protein
MLSASACYNILGCAFKLNTQVLRRIDHGCIYIMIAVRRSAALRSRTAHPVSLASFSLVALADARLRSRL